MRVSGGKTSSCFASVSFPKAGKLISFSVYVEKGRQTSHFFLLRVHAPLPLRPTGQPRRRRGGEREFLSRIVVGGREEGANFPGGGPKIIGKRGWKKREKNWRWGRSNATSTLHFLAPSSPWSRRVGGNYFPTAHAFPFPHLFVQW